MLFMRLKVLEIIDENTGICVNIHKDMTVSPWEEEKLKAEMLVFVKKKGWYSGVCNMPIAHKNRSPSSAYFSDEVPMWSLFTQYGRRRRAIMKHLDKHLLRIRNENTPN